VWLHRLYSSETPATHCLLLPLLLPLMRVLLGQVLLRLKMLTLMLMLLMLMLCGFGKSFTQLQRWSGSCSLVPQWWKESMLRDRL
jgi:hypothetical protein